VTEEGILDQGGRRGGGWKNEGTVSRCYLQSDPETVRTVVLNLIVRLVSDDP